ncbi:MAG: MaoC family dehydratase N-terminal domain-containing protein [Labilithrix sp.]|nr:MaoC family dehydratase N-terminal domain-containing protein [Labilithrix sp.]MCW5811915.1 MaoC family dehydratase N-terminal domain-containing protein [Labilithrix sp.]
MPLDLSLVGHNGSPHVLDYTWKDTALYALGIGAKKDELDYLYEGRGPKVIPSFAVVPMFAAMLERVVKTGGDLAMVVHGSERARVHAPFPPSGRALATSKIDGIYDMRKFAIVMIDTTIQVNDELVAETRTQIIIRNAGGFGGTTPPKEEKAAEIPKDRAEPDFRVEEKTTPEQALLYRLSGDLNPLHADPEFAAKVGFEQGPILHGLCTYGHMVRHVTKGALGGDASKLTGFGCTFRKPVWPGDTLVTEGWKLDGGRIALQVKVKERDEAVCTAAYALSA